MNTKYQYSNSQFTKSKKKGEANNIVTINKREAYKKSGALQITFYQ